jgi:hypothetical protein
MREWVQQLGWHGQAPIHSALIKILIIIFSNLLTQYFTISDMSANITDYSSIEKIKTPILILFYGKIANGKSTLMQKYSNYKNIDLMCEPLCLWENFHGVNLLELRYKNGEKYEFLFSILAYMVVCRLHMAIFHWPLSSTATKENDRK